MVFRNTWRDHLMLGVILGLIFGPLIGLIFGLLDESWTTGIFAGLGAVAFWGGLIGGINAVETSLRARGYDKQRAVIAQNRRVVCDGVAVYMNVYGWMFLTSVGLEYYPVKSATAMMPFSVPTKTIQSVTILKKNQIVVATTTGLILTFQVARGTSGAWKAQIEAEMRRVAAMDNAEF